MEATGPRLEATIYKGTTLPHIVVRRRCVLHGTEFTTYQTDKNPSSGKVWSLNRRATLEPASSKLIRTHERHLRKAGPLRALSAYARDKNVLRLYCFRVEWPDKYAPSHGSSVELGFETLAEAQEWYEAVNNIILLCLTSVSGSIHRQYSLVNGSISAGLTPADFSAEPSPFASPVSSLPNTPHNLSKHTSMAGGIDITTPSPPHGDDDAAGSTAMAAAASAAASRYGLVTPRGPSPADGQDASDLLNRSTAGGVYVSANGSTRQLSHGGAYLACDGSSHGGYSGAGALQPSSNSGAAALSAGIRGSAQGGRSVSGHSSSSTTGVVVDDRMVRWVPYKHANGMAIYYRQTPADEGISQASGEYMLSTTVQASPDCCLSNLMFKADKHGSILSTAAFMEVLEDNGDMQVWHMVFHPAGNAGLATVLAAPRYTFMHQVHTNYEDGVHAVLFSSVPDHDVKPEWVERARARTQSAHRAVLRSDPGSGSRRAIWKTPVRCNITGAITLSALEGRSGRDSPQTLVTCIVRADWGGWLSSKSTMYGLGQSLGLQEALMDRVLMRVMILKEDVEYSRFKTKPFQLLMVTDDLDGNRQDEEQQQQQQQQIQQHHTTAAAAAAAAAALRQSSNAAAVCMLSNSGSGSLAATQPPAGPPPPPAAAAAPGVDSSAGGSRSAAAAAAAAAARVSAAASALAAHMTNPQQLWNEKRGSGSGIRSRRHSLGSTPPRSPLKGAAQREAVFATSHTIGGQLQGQQLMSEGGVRPKVTKLKSTMSAPEGPTSQAPLRLQLQPQQEQQQQHMGLAPTASAAVGPGAASQQQQQPGGLQQARSAAGDDFDSFTDAAEQLPDVGGAAGLDGEDGMQELHDSEAANNSSSEQVPLPYTEEELGAMISGTLNRKYWEAIHDGVGSVRDVYSIRGPHYLRDRKKIAAGKGRYKLMAADLVATNTMMDHIGRYLPSVRMNGAAFSFVVDLIINYGSPVLHLVMVFSTDKHPNSLGPCPDDPLDAGEEWTPFDFTMSRFLHGSDEERNGMFKLIPHCAKGSWVVSQSVGTTPVILGRKLATTYHQCDRYIEVDVDVASTPAVSYIVKMVQGATRSMLIDHAYLLESHFAHELPESLIGAIRYKHLDMTDYKFVSVDQELPFSPVVPGIVGQ